MRKISYIITALLLLTGTGFSGDYIIGDGDTLEVSVWGNRDLSITAMVRPDGKISLPVLGDILASGLTPVELTEVLKKELEKVVKQPTVTVIVKNPTNFRVYVFGKGVTPGVITLSRDMTLIQFLAQLGLSENADLHNACLIRNREKIKTDFSDLFEKGDFSQDIALEPDDMVFIPDNFEKRVSIAGEVERPATLPYREGLRVLDLIVAAEGLTEYARESKVAIIRENGNDGPQVIYVDISKMKKGDIDNNIPLMPGDYVIVKDGFF